MIYFRIYFRIYCILVAQVWIFSEHEFLQPKYRGHQKLCFVNGSNYAGEKVVH